MTAVPRIRAINVTRLLGMFDYSLSFSSGSSNIIIIAPNGYGKTAFLSLINACLQFRLPQAAAKLFDTLEVIFADKTRWEFKRIARANPRKGGEEQARQGSWRARSLYRRRLAEATVEVKFFDKAGKHIKTPVPKSAVEIPVELIANALERVLPVHRIGVDRFIDIRTEEPLKSSEIFEKYYSELAYNDDFIKLINPFDAHLFEYKHQRINCVFIETQRLLFTKRIDKSETDDKAESQEEILRQSKSLSERIQNTYSNYAATSQGLDRTFPNRLIDLAGSSGAPDVNNLGAELDQIEKKRAALTAAGILDETSMPIRPPEGEYLANVANALKIYVEDSKTKLATFDDLFSKVSVFKELLAKKLKPKELLIGRANGAEVRRGATPLPLTGLSSGEKHEFIMLFRLIFETPPSSLVLIDEPEISLHVVWQLEFMADLLRIQAANNFQCVIATHSPQIIQNAGDITIDLADQAK